MPYFTRKVTRKNCYRVKNKNTKRVFSKCSTKENTKKQIRLLRAIQYNKTFKLLPKGQRPSDKKLPVVLKKKENIDSQKGKNQKSTTKRKNQSKIRKSCKYIR